MSDEVVEVAAAVLLRRDRVWIQRRRNTGHLDGYWEFPGGKIKPGETPSEAVRREVREETEAELTPDAIRPLCVHEHAYQTRRVRIHFFLCRSSATEMQGPGKWVALQKLKNYRFPPANRPALDLLESPG